MILLSNLGKLMGNTWNEACLNTFHPYFTVRYFSKVVDLTAIKEMYGIQADDDLEARLEEKETEISKKRNKSMLWPQHYNILHGKMPYDEAKNETHLSLKYKRRMFGRYGYDSDVNPGALWLSKVDIKEIREYEKVAYPFTIHEMWERAQQRLANEEEAIKERQAKIVSNLKKLEQWKQDIADRTIKRMQLAAASKAKKEALIEEVRRHLGFKVDPKDERFKEMLLQKERDQKKKLKAEKAEAKQQRLLALLAKSESTT